MENLKTIFFVQKVVSKKLNSLVRSAISSLLFFITVPTLNENSLSLSVESVEKFLNRGTSLLMLIVVIKLFFEQSLLADAIV
jgi:hypothetical protein